jgi:tetratricopeptide (TPR) repeat protein
MAKTPKKRSPKSKQPSRRPAVEFDGFDPSGHLGVGDAKNIAVVVLIAFALRTTFFLLNKHDNPVFYHPIMDGEYHNEWAQQILHGDFWGQDVYFRAPLYPYFLALLYKISGSSIAFAVFVQHLLGAASCGLVYGLARQFFRAHVALLAGVLAALYWPLVYFEGDLLIVTLIIFLDLVAFILLVRSTRSMRLSLAVSAGLVLGMSAIARPNILILLPLIPFVYAAGREKIHDGKTGTRFWLRRTVLVYAGATLVILPVLIRNYVVGHDIVPIASQGGVNFYIGNNPQSDGRTAVVPGTRWDWWGGYEDAVHMAETARGRKLRPSEVSDYFFTRGLEFIVTDPGRSIPLIARKIYLFWAAGERSNNKYIYFFWRLTALGRVPLVGFWLVAPLALLGGALLWRRRRQLALLYLFVVAYSLGVIAFFVNARFRLPVVPILIIFAAYAALYLWHAFRRRTPGLVRALPVLLLCFVAVDADFLTFKENRAYANSLSYYSLGNAYLKMDDTDGAIREYERALDADRRYPTPGFRLIARNVDFNLGRLYAGKERCARAIPHLERVGGSDQYTGVAKETLADCYMKEKRFADAVQAYSEVVELDPQSNSARSGLAAAYLGEAGKLAAEGDRDGALALLETAHARIPERSDITDELRRLRERP